jgi:hypothetical protein
MYTPYKQVAYEVWLAVSKKQPAPTPNYQAAQRTRVTIGLTPTKRTANPLKDLVLKRGTTPVAPVDRSLDGGGGRFTFDLPAFAANGTVTLDMVGSARTVTCVIDQATLQTFR